jgi:hypothetical protein
MLKLLRNNHCIKNWSFIFGVFLLAVKMESQRVEQEKIGA